jgi:hypothetical protein
MALQTLHNGLPTANWNIMRPILEKHGHDDIINAVVFDKERHRIDRNDFRTLIGMEHDR